MPVPLGPCRSEVEIVDGNRLTVLAQLAMALPDEPNQRAYLTVRRLEIGEDGVEGRLFERGHRLVRVGDGSDLVSIRFEELAQRGARMGFTVDDQKAGHGRIASEAHMA